MEDGAPQNEADPFSGIADTASMDTDNQLIVEPPTGDTSMSQQSMTVQGDCESSQLNLDVQEKMDSGNMDMDMELIPEDTDVRFKTLNTGNYILTVRIRKL